MEFFVCFTAVFKRFMLMGALTVVETRSVGSGASRIERAET